jgi:hypothetical protein
MDDQAGAERKAEKIRKFLDENPHIYAAFEREALLVRARGFKHYSARTIIHYLRHRTAIGADPFKNFKVNDHISPTLARDFLDRHQEIPSKFFELRDAVVERIGGK